MLAGQTINGQGEEATVEASAATSILTALKFKIAAVNE